MTGGGAGGGSAGGAGGGNACGGCVSGATGQCLAGDTASACGTGGNACRRCRANETCSSGMCVAASCGPQNCDGCCTNNFCVPTRFQSSFACGLNGTMCAGCMTGQTCNAGACEAAPDAGPPVMPGSPCTQGSDCRPPSGATCIPESAFGQATGYTDGYCTQSCGTSSPCPTSSECVEIQFGQRACRASCRVADIGMLGACRTGYVCAPTDNTSTAAYCRPRCDVSGSLSGCSTGQTCDTATGLCH